MATVFSLHFLIFPYRINLLISKADSALQTKTNTTSLESELAELQKSMNKWKNNAKKFKMER